MFANVEDATRAMNTLNGFSIFGKHIKVSLARRRDANDKSCKLYATKIPMNYSTYALHELFVQVSFSRSTFFHLQHFSLETLSNFVYYWMRKEIVDKLHL